MKSKSCLHLALLMLVMIVGLFCVSFQVKGAGFNPKIESFLASLNSFPKTSQGQAEKDSLLKLYRFFEIVDKPLFQKLQTMSAYSDSSEIDSLIRVFKKQKDLETRPDTPDKNEWWEEMWESRASYCDYHYRSHLFNDYWDLRARPVILHGMPDEDYQEEEEGYDVFYLHWVKEGIFLCLKDEDQDGHPDRYIPHKDFDSLWGMSESESLIRQKAKVEKYVTTAPVECNTFEEITKILTANLNIVSFPEADSSYTVWLSAGVPLNQFKPGSPGKISFHTEEVIYHMGNPPSVALIDSGFSVHISSELNWFPVYRGYRLPTGNYELIFTMKDGNENHLGVYQVEFQVPSLTTSKGMSDIVLSLLPPRNDYSATNRIIRQGNIVLLGDPFLVYALGDTIFPYVEFSIDNFTKDELGEYSYLLTSFLLPIKKKEKRTEVQMGPLYLLKDSTLALIRRLDKDLKKIRGEAYLIYSSGEKTELSRTIFASPIQIPKEIPEGEYLLVLSVENVNDKNTPGLLAWRQIAIKTKK
jgi:hypothetical protein